VFSASHASVFGRVACRWLYRWQRCDAKSDGECEREGPITRKLRMTAAVVAIALTPLMGIGTALADRAGFPGGGFHVGVLHGGAFRGGAFHPRASFVGRGFRGTGFGYGGVIGYTEPDTVAEAPSVFAVPNPAPAVAVDRPPCRETTAGVVIMRGTSCAHGAQ
jgi:hypothetical protein